MPDVNETEPMIVNNTFVQCEAHESNEGDPPVAKDKMDTLLEEQISEARRQYKTLTQKYPYVDGSKIVLGPEIFTDGDVISWKGENYVPQEQVSALMGLRSIAALHCRAIGELMYDAGVEMPDSALPLYSILMDELTLTIGALAENHPAVMPRLPRGMK